MVRLLAQPPSDGWLEGLNSHTPEVEEAKPMPMVDRGSLAYSIAFLLRKKFSSMLPVRSCTLARTAAQSLQKRQLLDAYLSDSTEGAAIAY